MLRIIKNLGVLFLIVCLTACSSSEEADTEPVTCAAGFPMNAIYKSFYTTAATYNFQISGNLHGITITGAGSQINPVASVGNFTGLNGVVSGYQQTVTATGSYTASLNGNSITQPLSTSSTDWVSTSYVALGTMSSSDYVVATSAPPLPTVAHEGETGIVYQAKVYSDNTLSNQTGTKIETYALQADSPNTALLVMTSSYADLTGTVTETDVQQFRITPEGNYMPVQTTVTDFVNQTVFTFTY